MSAPEGSTLQRPRAACFTRRALGARVGCKGSLVPRGDSARSDCPGPTPRSCAVAPVPPTGSRRWWRPVVSASRDILRSWLLTRDGDPQQSTGSTTRSSTSLLSPPAYRAGALVLRHPTLEYQHEQPSHILHGWQSNCSVAFPVRQPHSHVLQPQRIGCAPLTGRSHINVRHERHDPACRGMSARWRGWASPQTKRL